MQYLYLIIGIAVIVVVVFAVLGFQGAIGDVASGISGIGESLGSAISGTQDFVGGLAHGFGEATKSTGQAFADVGATITEGASDIATAVEQPFISAGQFLVNPWGFKSTEELLKEKRGIKIKPKTEAELMKMPPDEVLLQIVPSEITDVETRAEWKTFNTFQEEQYVRQRTSELTNFRGKQFMV